MTRSTLEEAQSLSAGKKATLRRKARATRRQIAADLRSAHDLAIQQQVLKHPWFIAAQQVLLYEAFDGEVSTRLIAERARAANKTVAYARITESRAQLEFIVPKTWAFARNGFPEPQGARCMPDDDALIIVPGVLFDQCGYRLGMGGGYYDNLLSRESSLSIGLAYEAQVVESVPIDKWDRPVCCIVTESTTYHLSKVEHDKWIGSKRLLGSSAV